MFMRTRRQVRRSCEHLQAIQEAFFEIEQPRVLGDVPVLLRVQAVAQRRHQTLHDDKHAREGLVHVARSHVIEHREKPVRLCEIQHLVVQHAQPFAHRVEASGRNVAGGNRDRIRAAGGLLVQGDCECKLTGNQWVDRQQIRNGHRDYEKTQPTLQHLERARYRIDCHDVAIANRQKADRALVQRVCHR